MEKYELRGKGLGRTVIHMTAESYEGMIKQIKDRRDEIKKDVKNFGEPGLRAAAYWVKDNLSGNFVRSKLIDGIKFDCSSPSGIESEKMMKTLDSLVSKNPEGVKC